MKIYSKLIILIILLFSTFLYGFEKQKILILHSYHQTFKWTDDINKGITSIFKNSTSNIEFYIEYMDTKRFVDDIYYDKLFNIYKKKYNKTSFDLIISSDNNAFNFLKKYNKTLFKNSPVVFSGVNYLKKEQIKNHKNFTGVNEKPDIKINFDLILKLHPNTKNIVIITDTTTTGKSMRKETLNIIKNYKNKDVTFSIIDDITIKDLKNKITNLEKNSAILLTIFFRSKDNKVLEYYEISELINSISDTPLYGLWDFNLEHGIAGGFLTSGFFQGKQAAIMAKKILQGKDVKDIPIEYKSPNQYMFDYKHFEKYNIDETLLPKISYIKNRPYSFFEEYKKEIVTLTIIFLFMFLLIIFLFINIQEKKHAQKSVKKQLRFQQELIDNVHAPIYYKNTLGKYIGCNKAFEELIGQKKDAIINKNVHEILPKNIADIYFEKDKEILKNGISQKYEVAYNKDSKNKKNLIFYKNVYFNESNEIDGLIGAIFDITKLKKATNKLSKLNKNLEDKVDKRTLELKTTIENLEKTQKQLIISEKMASLGGLVAGVAHEINTPVGIGVTGSSHFIEVTKGITTAYEKDIMTQEDFEEYLKMSNELAQSIHINLLRTAQLIKSFKQISFDQTSEEKRDFLFKIYLEEILLSMTNILKKTKLQIQIQCEENIRIVSYPGAFSQIITNLIINSINHAYKKNEEGNILIKVNIKEEKFILTYKDDGKGISKENINKIFDPFFTTNRENGGTGLGLNVLYNIVTNNLNGTITCKSEENHGVEFVITFDI